MYNERCQLIGHRLAADGVTCIRCHTELVQECQPTHRGDRPVDACSLVVQDAFRAPSDSPCVPPHGACDDYPPRHAAARVAAEQDER